MYTIYTCGHGPHVQPGLPWVGDPCLTECQCVKWLNIMSGLGPMVGSCERGKGPSGVNEQPGQPCSSVLLSSRLFTQRCCTPYQKLIVTAVNRSVVGNLLNC